MVKTEFGGVAGTLPYVAKTELSDMAGTQPPLDECTAFMKTVEITPESPLEFQSRKNRDYKLVEIPRNNTGLVVKVYNEGTSQERFEVVNANWRMLRKDGLVAILSAQRQQAVYTVTAAKFNSYMSRWEEMPGAQWGDVIYYGLPVCKDEANPDVSK